MYQHGERQSAKASLIINCMPGKPKNIFHVLVSSVLLEARRTLAYFSAYCQCGCLAF